MATSQLPSKIIAGISVPDTPLIDAAISLAHKHLDEMSYNHVMRTLLIGFAVADRIPPMQSRDREVHALAAILHDLSWDLSGPFVSPDKRFEVDSAEAARNWVRMQVADSDAWDRHRLQLLWDAIALHTTPSVGQHKEVEVGATGLGIGLDFMGAAASPGGSLTQQEWDTIAAEFPREGFRDGVTRIMCHLCRTKPETTYDNFVGDFGEELVEGYSRKGKRAFDFMSITPE